ncbi:methyl-accepting chemotaxis sensory transducer [Thermoanaerobacter mathranii subsp. mathranii str. A3]|uniref:Methyl-accepting chemotaxis sensory transducer n=1 Tax=Thermoanaerobacter mathranii subsp. mathranii (strain DSM 11426 / CCUG 53645 / CIP 108742 / A3) TaxID=583358 RepID=A0ABN3Z301_THEM3|nr:methyl-accepting chemotaxis protein [Thermoanaerobacter mathranii]ADH60456.1 methyl-accepting chemotaxis sensory transducer [Thermoanaerobacter mathranii subsp. mathranii str. A3]
MINVGIVGGGKGGTAILKVIHGLPEVSIVGIADIDENAPGIKLAKEKGIKTFHDCVDLLKIPELDLVIEVTGNPKVQEILYTQKRQETVIIDANAARLMMIIVEAKEDIAKKLYIQAQELAGTAEELSDTIKEIKNAAKEVADGAEELAARGSNLNDSATSARDYAKNIGDVLAFIKRVASQTKLLGLNAAIEAARAGEQGRGFAVVADEVRKLAEDSAQAVEQISNILQNIEQSVEKIVEEISKTAQVTEVQAGATQQIVTEIVQLEYAVENLRKVAQQLVNLS